MSGMVYAFMTATSVDLDGNEDEREELNGWIDREWSMTVLHDSRNDVLPLVKEWESDSEELADSVRDVLGDGSLWEDNGDGTFYGKDETQEDGKSFTYAVHFFVKDCINGKWCETPWHPETDGGITLSE